MNRKQIFCIVALLLFQLGVFAQSSIPASGDTDFMRSNGKIFVVMTVVLVILIGLFVYLFSIDRKITKLESKQ